jgi:hypothetical protein
MATGRGPICTLKCVPARDQRLLALSAAASVALASLLALAGHPELLAYAAPLLVLALPLALGRYLGEETLERLRSRSHRRVRRPRPVAEAPRGRRFAALVPRGARLIAHGLAERGPPVPAAP